MPGFFVSNAKIDLKLYDPHPELCLAQELDLPGATAKRQTLNKFLADKALVKTDMGILVAEGALLNKSELYKKYGVDTVEALLLRMYELRGETFAAELRGPFTCALYFEQKDLWLVYTNPTGENPVFYSLHEGVFFAGSQVNYLIDACRQQGIGLTFDTRAAYEMLTFGYMESNHTYANEIKRLRGGTYLRVEHGRAEVREYFIFRKNPARYEGCTEEEMVDAIDEAFKLAAEREYSKDEEYGLVSLSELSGGLDSRMTMWVGHANKPRHMQLMTYCRSNYLDELIAKEIANYWDDEILVKSLDDVRFLYDIDETVFMLGGLSFYSGITGGKRMLESLNMPRFGLDHTGQIGGSVIGSQYHHPEEETGPYFPKLYSHKLFHRLEESHYHENFCDTEVYQYYTRGFQGSTNTHMIRRNFTEPVSPYLDVDLMQTCMDIPARYRMYFNLYKKWILAKYPDAAKFRWESRAARFTDPEPVIFVKKLISRGPGRLMTRLGHPEHDNNHMNPLEYWMHRKSELRAYLDDYEAKGYACMPADAPETLIGDMKELYANGTVVEKTMVLTVLGAAKMYFHVPEGR